MIDISKKNKAAILAALYNASQPLGLGFLHFTSKPMTIEQAQTIIDSCGVDLYCDYLKGRVMKVNLSESEFDERLYDRDNGPGAAQRAIKDIPDCESEKEK